MFFLKLQVNIIIHSPIQSLIFFISKNTHITAERIFRTAVINFLPLGRHKWNISPLTEFINLIPSLILWCRGNNLINTSPTDWKTACVKRRIATNKISCSFLFSTFYTLFKCHNPHLLAPPSEKFRGSLPQIYGRRHIVIYS